MELLRAYNQSGRLVKTQDRDVLLPEIKAYSLANGDANYAVECINLLLINSKGEVYITKRGDLFDNPFLYDKTVGGHVTSGERFDTTVVREAQEELGIEVIIADMFDYEKHLLKEDLTRVAVVRPIDFKNWHKSIRRSRNGEVWVKRHRVGIFAGRYDGKVAFVDGETVDMQLIPKAELIKDVVNNPEKYTYDLKDIFDDYACMLR